MAIVKKLLNTKFAIALVAFTLLQPVATIAVAGPLPLWELETDGNRVLVMGSVHFLRPTDWPLSDGLMDAYEQADTLVMEIDMDALNPLEAMAAMTSMGVDPSGRSLRELVGAKTYDEARSRADALGIPFAAFDQFEPWFAALSISQFRVMQLGLDPNWGIETQFTQRAAADGKPIHGLETIQQQLGFMDQLDATTQREFLLLSLDDAETVEEELEGVMQAWRTGDAQAMEQLLLEGLAEAPELYDAILVERNRNWVPMIKELTEGDENVLVVVGAMHLVGNDSVLAMLEREGIKSRQLRD